MPFDLQTWKSETAKNLQSINDWLKRRHDRDLPYVAYGALATAAAFPLVEAAQQGQILPMMMTLGGIAAGVGGNLLAEQVQRWADRADTLRTADIEQWVDAEVPQNTDLRTTLDAILQAVEAIPAAKTNLPETDRAEFAALLAADVQKLGSTITITGDDNIVATNHSVAAKEIHGDVITDGGKKEVHIHPDPAEAARTQFRKTYLERFAAHCNVLPLGALGGNRGDEDDITLDAVYIALDTKTRVPLTEAEKKERKKDIFARDEKDRPLTAIEAATRHKKLALVGDPGSGKSTFVKQLAGWLAQSRLAERPAPDGWDTALFPLLVALRDLTPRLAELDFPDEKRDTPAARKKLVAAMDAQWRADFIDRHRLENWADRFDSILAQEKLLLIFDGLDEVPEKMRPRVNAAVRAVLNAYPNIERAIVTCRVRSYTGNAELAGFAKHELAPFDADKIRAFVAHWYDSQPERWGETERERRKENLIGAVLADELRPLAANPMLLTTMAIIHQQDNQLPKQRVVLYNRAVEILTKKWQEQKDISLPETVKTLLKDDLKLRRVLQLLAYQLHHRQAAGTGNELARKDIIGILEKKEHLGDAGVVSDFLDYVDQRAGLLVGRGGDGDKPQLYDFPHRTFQEYLAGCQMVEGRDAVIKREYYARSAEGDFWYLAGQLGAEELKFNRKSEPTLLDLAYELCPAGVEPHKVEHWRRVLWSGQMALVLGKETIETDHDCETGGTVYLARLIPRLVKLLEGNHLTPIERAQAGDVLARLGDPRPGVGVIARPGGSKQSPADEAGVNLPDIVWCHIPAGEFLMGEGKKQHRLSLPEYWMSRYPVTNAQYEAFVADGGYTDKWRRCWTEAGWQWKGNRQSPHKAGGVFDLPNHPVVVVSWYEAVAYAAWLNEKLRNTTYEIRIRREGKLKTLNLEPETAIVRLPSEAEWEKAARGVDGRRYPWGDDIDANLLNYGETGIGTTSAVGAFPGGVSPSGCMDMSGNVWEWCSTKWREKAYLFNVENEWTEAYLSGDATRVLRGGAFNNTVNFVRCAFRLRRDPDIWHWDGGFRVMLSPKSNEK